MKLRNKRTGEKAEVEINYNSMLVTYEDGMIAQYYFDSLKDLEEWEDVPEEPKEYWFIAELCAGLQRKQDTDNGEDRFNKQIGNYFETKEEAEKALEKLKAWKRLKDKGFRLNHWKEAKLRPNMSCVSITGNIKVDEEAKADLDLLFGGEE